MTENQLFTGMSIQEDVLRLRLENEQLKKENEKLRSCLNCKYRTDKKTKCLRNVCKNIDICKEWELAE